MLKPPTRLISQILTQEIVPEDFTDGSRRLFAKRTGVTCPNPLPIFRPFFHLSFVANMSHVSVSLFFGFVFLVILCLSFLVTLSFLFPSPV